VVNETNILSSILDIPAKPEPSFQAARLEQNAGERFDRVLQDRVDFRQDEAPPAASQKFEAKERLDHSEQQTPAARDEQTPPPQAKNEQSDSRPVTADSERRGPAPLNDEETHSHSAEPAGKVPVNPFALPLERLARELNPTDGAPGLVDNTNQAAVDVLAELFGSQGLNTEGSPAIDTLKELLAGLNIDSETIDQLVTALNNGDAAGVQGILNALRGLLNASNQVAQAPVAEIVAEVAGNRLNPPEQLALKLLVQAGLTETEAQQVIQQVRAGNTPQPATDNSTQLSKTAIDAMVSKLNSENSNGSGNLQNGDSSGSAKNSSEGPRNFTGLAADRLETLASLVAPDKAGNAQTNPLIAKLAASPLLNASGQPVQGALAEGTQAPAAVADAAAKGVEFVKPAVTETYNGRASMDKPITAQIIEKFTLRGFGNQREVHIKLDPPSLGTVRMNVSTSGESVRATIIAENHVVKSIIENNLSQLKDSITHQGVKIDSFNVLVGGNASQSAEGYKTALDYLGQLGREGSMGREQAEESVTLHRPIFMNENQSFSIFA
jgi:flagellar hook-length control protein FliK